MKKTLTEQIKESCNTILEIINQEKKTDYVHRTNKTRDKQNR